MKKHLIYIILALATLPIVLFSIDKTKQLLGRAAPQIANININTQDIIGPLKKPWSGFAQGGEEPPPMLRSIVSKFRNLSPSFVRLDHVYDSYDVVKRSENGYTYNFSRLDETVNDIIQSGALPFLSLSYMPNVFTKSGSLIDTPNNWSDWQNLVQKTIEHYSGKTSKNLKGVYYEVWNEPDLPQFGSWKLNSSKDYRLLYYYAAKGSESARETNDYYFGGPSVGSYYPNWVKNFVSHVSQNDLRLDFYSWHRYTKKPDEYVRDSVNIRNLLSKYPKYANIPLIITEWGIESENTSINNSNTAASFSVKTASIFYPNIHLAFSFEIKDGPPPQGGKWGLFSHEKDTSPLSEKPRFKAFAALNKLKGERLKISGEGTYVSGIATKDAEKIVLVLSNYDLSNQNTENVPVTFSNLAPLSYELKYTYVLEGNSGKYDIVSTNGIVQKQFLMKPNSVLLIELTSLSEIANFIKGPTNKDDDQALVLKNNNAPLVISYPEFRLLPSGNISFDIKPLWDDKDNQSFFIFEIPFSTESGTINKLYLSKQVNNNEDSLVFGIEKPITHKISSSIQDWQKNTWHKVNLNWSPTNISISVDGKQANSFEQQFDIRNGKTLLFYPINAAIDNLKIVMGNQLISRFFNGSANK